MSSTLVEKGETLVIDKLTKAGDNPWIYLWGASQHNFPLGRFASFLESGYSGCTLRKNAKRACPLAGRRAFWVRLCANPKIAQNLPKCKSR